jgi:hypothetical protein
MATEKAPDDRAGPHAPEPGPGAVLAVLGVALVGVLLTRGPVARPAAFESDEVNFLQTIAVWRVPMQHTLFLAAARAIGRAVGDAYGGFVILDMLVSAGALTAAWWWLRAVVRPATAAAATLVLAAAPVFWSYGAMAGNYTAIVLVGSVLLGIAERGRRAPRAWHPFAAAVVLAAGTGYRQDIGVFWLPVFLVIVGRHRWLAAGYALLVFLALNLAWLVPMLREAGGWQFYRQATADFAERAGYDNSFWNLGLIDGPVRHAVKMGMALAWTLGPGLAFVPRGLLRLVRSEAGGVRAALLALGVGPALAFHLLVHFGVAGYAFHYVPALLALLALGIGRSPVPRGAPDRAPARLGVLATALAAVFLLYPTDYDRPGRLGDFDLAFARHTRIGLRTRPPVRDPSAWRTINSQELPGGHRAEAPRARLSEIWGR